MAPRSRAAKGADKADSDVQSGIRLDTPDEPGTDLLIMDKQPPGADDVTGRYDYEPVSSVAEAEARRDRIKAGLVDFGDVLAELQEADIYQDWKVLGHDSFADYYTSEFAEAMSAINQTQEQRRKLAYELVEKKGLSYRKVAELTGDSHMTIARRVQAAILEQDQEPAPAEPSEYQPPSNAASMRRPPTCDAPTPDGACKQPLTADLELVITDDILAFEWPGRDKKNPNRNYDTGSVGGWVAHDGPHSVSKPAPRTQDQRREQHQERQAVRLTAAEKDAATVADITASGWASQMRVWKDMTASMLSTDKPKQLRELADQLEKMLREAVKMQEAAEK